MRKVVTLPLLVSLYLSLTLHLLSISHASLHLPRPTISIKAQNGIVTMELWCVAKNNAEDAALQSALDWACGPGGAECSPIQRGGPCYDPSDIQSAASYAFNEYFLKHGMTDDSCYFDNNAALTSLNPSHDKCKFPSSKTISNGRLSSPTTALGIGSNEDMNGCAKVSLLWLWPLMVTTLLFITLPLIT